MYVCLCNAITDQQIRDAADSGAYDLWDLQARLGIASQCGSCRETAADILRENRRLASKTEPQIWPVVA